MTNGVVVLGVWRSGTSLVTQFISEMGYYVVNTIPPNEFNPDGYWEDERVNCLNERVLNYLGGDSNHIPVEGPLSHSQFSGITMQIREVMQEYKSKRKWCIKDPRLSLTMDLWKEHLSSNTKYIICFRNPLSVSMSIQRRFQLDLNYSSRLWYTYLVSAFRVTRDVPRLVLSYENVLSNPVITSARIREFLSGHEGKDFLKVNPSHTHHKNTSEEVFGARFIAKDAKLLYSLLLRMDNEPQIRSVIENLSLKPPRYGLKFKIYDKLKYLSGSNEMFSQIMKSSALRQPARAMKNRLLSAAP